LRFDIALPVYNEEATLKFQVRRLDDYLNTLNFDEHEFRILISDNGSLDQTKQVAEILANEIQRVSLIVVGEKGVGLALRKAWENSDADVVGYMDLDLSTDITHLNEVIAIFTQDNCDVLNASRLLPLSEVSNRKKIRSLTSRGLNILIRSIFKTNLSDAMCGFKFVKRSTLESAIKCGATSNGWFFVAQLLLVAEMTGLRVREIPISWVDDGNSKVKIVQLIKQYIFEIFKLRKTIMQSKYRNFVRL
jgi:glycosyltransferase involved in cell wall biosynthesis